MHAHYQGQYQAQVAAQPPVRIEQPDPDDPLAPEKANQAAQQANMAAQRASRDVQRKMQAELAEEELEASRKNWRPLVSYTANLSRVGQQLLNTDGAWRNISKTFPAEFRDELLNNSLGPQYPWYWSAGVLAALFGISACILNFRVRSLDRLK